MCKECALCPMMSKNLLPVISSVEARKPMTFRSKWQTPDSSNLKVPMPISHATKPKYLPPNSPQCSMKGKSFERDSSTFECCLLRIGSEHALEGSSAYRAFRVYPDTSAPLPRCATWNLSSDRMEPTQQLLPPPQQPQSRISKYCQSPSVTKLTSETL